MIVRQLSSGTCVLDHTSYSPALHAAARAIPGCRKSDSKAICGSVDAIAAAVDYLVKERGLREDCFENTNALVPLTKFCHSGGAYDSRLREYQKDAVLFLRTQKRAILADDMGLGKTASAIAAALSFLTSKRTLIVCPSYVRGVWCNPHDGGELMKWAGPNHPVSFEAFECKGTKPPEAPLSAAPTDWAICHYDILHAWAEKIIAWKPEIVIFDECHFLMNPETRRTQAAKMVSARAPYVWGLSGTPMTNRPKDLWGVLDTIVPGRFGDDFFSFGVRYCGAYKEAVTPEKTVWKFDSSSHLEELNTRLRHIMLRRTKTDVALELPPKTRQVIRCDIGTRKLTSQIIQGGGALRAALAVAADAKLKNDAVPLINNHLDSGAKVVVFTYRRAVAEYLARECGGAVVHGGISQAVRGKTIHERRHAADARNLLCATIDAAGAGIDLSYADIAVFVELTYEPHELLQAEARLHRFGARNPVLIQYLIARGTTDELIADVVIGKLDVLERSIGGFEETGLNTEFAGSETDIMKELYERLGL